jgi:flagellar hook-associated protein 3
MSGWGAIYNNTTYAISQQTALLAKLQEQAASGLRVVRASDDPASAYRIMDLRSQSQSLDSYLSSVDTVSGGLDNAYTMLQQISADLGETKQALTQMSTVTYSQAQRSMISQQIDSLLKECVSLANSKRLGQYVLGGNRVDAPPYAVQTSNGRIVGVAYQGGLTDLPVPVGPGLEYSQAVVGDEVFRSHQRSAPIFLGSTGAKAGNYTSTVRGDQWLAFRHTTTDVLTAGTGLAPGSGSPAGDTILGAHVLKLDADAGRVALDDGPYVAFTAADTNLKLTNAAGEVVYMDMSGLDSGLSGNVTIDIRGNGQMSLDDWQTATVISFTAHDAASGGAAGGILYVDNTGIRHAGLEPVRVPGTYDLFATLIQIRDTLQNTRQLPQSQQTDLLAQAIASVEELTGNVMQTMTGLGARTQAMDSLKKTLEDMKASAGIEIARFGDADIAIVATELARTQTFYQMTLQSASKLLSMSLLDYI